MKGVDGCLHDQGVHTSRLSSCVGFKPCARPSCEVMEAAVVEAFFRAHRKVRWARDVRTTGSSLTVLLVFLGHGV